MRSHEVLLFCVLLVLAPPGGWRGKRATTANRIRNRRAPPGGFFSARADPVQPEHHEEPRHDASTHPTGMAAPARRPARPMTSASRRHAAAAARAPDPLLPDRRHAGRDAGGSTRAAIRNIMQRQGRPAAGGHGPLLDPRPGRGLEYARRLKPQRDKYADDAGDRDARVLREAAHHGGLEGPDQRPLPRRELPHRRGPAHRAPAAGGDQPRWACRRAASSST
jgi:hypothetical protein